MSLVCERVFSQTHLWPVYDVLYLIVGNRMSFGVTMTPILFEQQGSLKKSQSFYKRRKLKTLFSSSAHLSPLNVSLYRKSPSLGGLLEAVVKSLKLHLKKVVEVKLTFEEFMTVLTQIEACFNSRPLTQIPSEDDRIEALTPGHCLISQPLEAIPEPVGSYRLLPILRRWHLCQSLVCHFWQRWSDEYLVSLRRYNKWQSPTRIVHIVVLREDALVPCKWPLGRVEVHKRKTI